MIKILEKGRNITTTDHANIFNIFMIQPEFMLAGFLFFKNIQCHTLARYSTAPPPMVPEILPFFPTSMREPAPLGVDPEDAVTEQVQDRFPPGIVVLLSEIMFSYNKIPPN